MEKIVFMDFDHTIIDGNSDVVIRSLAGKQDVPEGIIELSKDPNGWTQYMSQLFQYLHSKSVTEDDYKICLSTIPLVEGMKELLFSLKERAIEVIVLSDSNTFFIDFILNHYGIRDVVTKVFTNPADFDSSGCLRIKKFEEKNNCSICPDNLCKGHIVGSYREKTNGEIQFWYIGDGSNDVCPAIKLREKDIVFPREGYWLRKALEKMSPDDIKCVIKPWVSGYDIMKNI